MSKATIVSKEPFNTNNAWGFGGGIGTVTTYSNGYRMRKGTAMFRHLPNESFCRYFNGVNEIGPKEFWEVCEK